jgi:hypothetical protein
MFSRCIIEKNAPQLNKAAPAGFTGANDSVPRQGNPFGPLQLVSNSIIQTDFRIPGSLGTCPDCVHFTTVPTDGNGTADKLTGSAGVPIRPNGRIGCAFNTQIIYKTVKTSSHGKPFTRVSAKKKRVSVPLLPAGIGEICNRLGRPVHDVGQLTPFGIVPKTMVGPPVGNRTTPGSQGSVRQNSASVPVGPNDQITKDPSKTAPINFKTQFLENRMT